MTRQEMFDIAIAGLVAQQGPAVEDDSCSYYTVDGNRCAIGHLFTVEEARMIRKIVKNGAAHLLHKAEEEIPAVKELDLENNTQFLIALQDMHDMSCMIASNVSGDFFFHMKKAALDVATTYELNVPKALEEM